MEYRVEQLAGLADVSVDTVRFYQSKALLPPPRRHGRIAFYGDEHLDRLNRIRRLQARGLTLATIRRLLDGELDEADEALVAAVSAGGDARGPSEGFTLDELAARSGIPAALLRAVAKEGLLVPHRVGGEPHYTESDVEAARAGLALLEAGLPLPEVLELARRHHAAMRAVAEQAVALFDAHIRQPLRSGMHTASDVDAAERLVDAFNTLLPATTTLVAHHFQRTLLAVAQEHIERVGADAEIAAVEREAARLS